MTPQPGSRIRVRNAYDEIITMVALTGPQAGRDFPIVWVCSENEYRRAEAAQEEPEGIPWPLAAVDQTGAETHSSSCGLGPNHEGACHP